MAFRLRSQDTPCRSNRRSSHTAGVDQVWKFRNLAVGDRVVADAGTTRVLGIGTVVGPWYYVPNVGNCHHVRVRWDDTTERRVDMLGWRKTLIGLSEETFECSCKAPGTSTPPPALPRPQAASVNRRRCSGSTEGGAWHRARRCDPATATGDQGRPCSRRSAHDRVPAERCA
jgi:hypothetical protein